MNRLFKAMLSITLLMSFSNVFAQRTDSLQVYFPLNDKFPVEDTSNNKYDERKVAPSIPPPTRFG